MKSRISTWIHGIYVMKSMISVLIHSIYAMESRISVWIHIIYTWNSGFLYKSMVLWWNPKYLYFSHLWAFDTCGSPFWIQLQYIYPMKFWFFFVFCINSGRVNHLYWIIIKHTDVLSHTQLLTQIQVLKYMKDGSKWTDGRI